ncbi:MAG TPA: T9SS type A sorting domain-containing protein [Flavobacterium sp.]|nr:T9SS type A sorting domain-containing protein [Flavobacterium sp.]
MRNFYLLAFLVSATFSVAQQQVLVGTQWQLITLTVGGISYGVPDNDEANPAAFWFTGTEGNYMVETDLCNLLFGTCASVDDSSFTLVQPIYTTLSLCNFGENMFFEGVYFSLFMQAGETPTSYTYSIVYLGDYPTLLVTAPNGDQAQYGAYFAGTDSFVRQGLTVTPNPATSYVDVTLSGGQSGELAVYDLTGRKCQSQHVSATERVDVSRLSGGCYLFSVTTPSGTTTQKVLIR